MSHSTQSRPESEAPISLTDMEFMLLIMQGHASSYSIWSYMKEHPIEYPRPTAYKNINQRLLRLARIGLLQGKVKFDTPESIHGRRDYSVTMYGLERLIPYFMAHPEKFKDLVEYMNKSSLDTQVFGDLLLARTKSMAKIVNEFFKYASIPTIAGFVTPEYYAQIQAIHETISNVKKDVASRLSHKKGFQESSVKVKSKGEKKPSSS